MKLPPKDRLKKIARRVGLSSLLVAAFFLLDRGPEIFGESKNRPDFFNHFAEAHSFYQHLVTFSPFTNSVQFVSVISLSKAKTPTSAFTDACVMRQYLSELLPKIQALSPKVIVLDLAFAKGSCSDKPQATENLGKAVQAAAASAIVVLGLASQTVEEALKSRELNRDQVRQLNLRSNELLLLEHENFALPGVDLREGLIRANEDPRKVPLTWSVREESHNTYSKASKNIPTLALQAAFAYHDSSGLQEVSRRYVHPLAVLSKPDDFFAVSSLCVSNADNPAFDWNGEDCVTLGNRPEPAVSMLPKLRSSIRPIVIVGWVDDESDFHPTPVGDIPGVYLQANYIEALSTSDRLLRPVSLWLQCLLSVLWFGYIEYQFWKFGVGKVLLRAVLVSLAVLLLCYAVVHNFGYYLELWPPSLAVILLRILQEYLRPTTEELATPTTP